MIKIDGIADDDRIALITLTLLVLLISPVSAVKVNAGVYNNPPLVFYENGEAKGLFIDLLEYIAKEEGWELKYTYSTFPVLLEKLEKEEIDILPALRTLERERNCSA